MLNFHSNTGRHDFPRFKEKKRLKALLQVREPHDTIPKSALGWGTPVHGRIASPLQPAFFSFFFISPRPLFLHGQSNSGETKSWDGLANRALSKNSLRWYFGFFFPRYIIQTSVNPWMHIPIGRRDKKTNSSVVRLGPPPRTASSLAQRMIIKWTLVGVCVKWARKRQENASRSEIGKKSSETCPSSDRTRYAELGVLLYTVCGKAYTP